MFNCDYCNRPTNRKPQEYNLGGKHGKVLITSCSNQCEDDAYESALKLKQGKKYIPIEKETVDAL